MEHCRDLLPRGLENDVSHTHTHARTHARTHTHTHTHKVTPLHTSKVTSGAILDLSNARQLAVPEPPQRDLRTVGGTGEAL